MNVNSRRRLVDETGIIKAAGDEDDPRRRYINYEIPLGTISPFGGEVRWKGV